MPFSASQEETGGELRGTLDKKVRGYIVTFGLRVSVSERAGYSVSGPLRLMSSIWVWMIRRFSSNDMEIRDSDTRPYTRGLKMYLVPDCIL